MTRHPALPDHPAVLTTTVGSYPVPDWLAAYPTDRALTDATRVILHTQERAGIDLPTDGELYRFDVNHPDTNGMIDHFVSRMGGIECRLGRSRIEAFRRKTEMAFRARPAGAVIAPLTEGCLDLTTDCARGADLAAGPFKFTLTSPYMLARTLLDEQYGDFSALTLALADVLADQVRELPCACLQVDEANLPGNPADGPLAAEAINRILDAFPGIGAVHLCFGNYGGQSIQDGTWAACVPFLDALHAGHVVLEAAHRPADELSCLKDVKADLALGLGVVDIKVNHVETPDEIAQTIETAESKVGTGRIRFVHPDCGFWMLKRSVADRKLESLVKGRDLFLGR